MWKTTSFDLLGAKLLQEFINLWSPNLTQRPSQNTETSCVLILAYVSRPVRVCLWFYWSAPTVTSSCTTGNTCYRHSLYFPSSPPGIHLAVSVLMRRTLCNAAALLHWQSVLYEIATFSECTTCSQWLKPVWCFPNQSVTLMIAQVVMLVWHMKSFLWSTTISSCSHVLSSFLWDANRTSEQEFSMKHLHFI